MKEALDSARAALRGGAAEVTIVSLESFEEMPVLRTTQGHEEFEEAKKEGVAFVPRRGPNRFLGGNRLEAVELRRVVSVFDENGRFAPRYDDERSDLASGRRLRPRDRPAAGPLVPEAGRRTSR